MFRRTMGLTEPESAHRRPGSSARSAYTAPLSLYINGTKQPDFTLTDAYSWYYGSYPFTNTPSDGNPYHFYDEVDRLFSKTYPAGTTFKLPRWVSA